LPQYGRVMPFWMAGSAMLNLTLVFEHVNRQSWRLAAIAFAIQVLAVLFSLSAPSLSTIESGNGLPNPFRATGANRSTGGICVIGLERPA
jgi:hypothetical protein